MNLHSITNLVIDMLEFLKEGKDITLISTIPPDFPKVYADENRLVQILFNLVHNAIKYTESGSIQISAKIKNGEQVMIFVRDTGVGIESTMIEKIFDPYEQIDSTQSMEAGIGIGLSVSKQLVEMHGGTINVHSSKEGTTFTFTIPLNHRNEIVQNKSYAKNTAIQENKRETTIDFLHSYQANSKDTILVVDDDPVNVKVIAQLLNEACNVITCLDPIEALNKISLQKIDLVIADVMMPKMSGYQLAEKIREKYPIAELPILLITARNTTEDIKIAFQSGANDYLIKPIDALELRIRVRALCNLKHYIKESQKYEAAWLQAQIQPHFLFNTLNTIASLAEVDSNEMVKMLHAFGNYLQHSFSVINLEPTVPIDHVLELANSYITIEKARFGDKLKVEFEIDKSISIKIPPLSIQPLLENAIHHGILKKPEGGTIKLTIKEYEKDVKITVSDNGAGMTAKKINEVLNVIPTIKERVGLKNTNRRLIHLYNKGLKIESEVGKGTTVSFHIPK